jgi:hypothetical protein
MNTNTMFWVTVLVVVLVLTAYDRRKRYETFLKFLD